MKQTQHLRIERYMRDFGSITPMQAFNDLGITKLSTRIGEMVRNGLPITKTPTEGVNRYGETTHYMTYRIKEENCVERI